MSSCRSSSRRDERRHDRKGKRKKHARDEKYYRNDKGDDDDNSMSSHDGFPRGNGLNGHNRHKRRRRHGTMDHDIPNVATAKDNPTLLVDQLHQLFTQYPNLATELPYYLIRMASGSSINLSRVSETDQELVRMLETLFQTMNCTCGASREWLFHARHGNLTDDNNKALSLVRWVRDELDMFGITMDKIGEYELSMQVHVPHTSMIKGANETESTPIMTSASTSSMENEIACLTQMVLEEFSPPPPPTSSSSLQPNTLAKELYDILNMIVQHEIVSLDGISDEKLKKSLEQLFLAIGLCREEMEDDSDDDDDDDQERDKEKVAYGYVMPESQEEDGPLPVQRNLDAAINACKALHQRWMQYHYQEQQQPQHQPQPNRPVESGKRVLGPCRPPPLQSLDATSFSSNQHEQSTGENNDEDEEDDFGPDPFASVKNKRTVSSMSKVRQQEASNPGTMSTLQNNAREEWMMQPGEHDFLKGVLSKGIKSRTFRNEKSKDMQSGIIADVPLDPKIQKQVDDIRKLHEQSRGPSLMEQHRERMEQQKREKQNQLQGGWSWNREKDLDAGRRVDKSHLHMVMGGASSELKNKFQGSYSKTFD